MNLDYYKILGVEKNCSSDDIKKAYKKLAVKYHPDKNQGELLSEEIFKKIKEAYETLSDPNKRSRYDQLAAYQSASRQSTQSSQSTTSNQYSKKENGISNLKARGIAMGFMALIVIIVLIVYPYVNQWASNDKLKSAMDCANNENWSEAFVYSSAAIEQWDENGKAYLLRAQISGSIYGKYQQAISDFNTAFSLLPQDSILGEHYYMRAKAHHETGDLTNACDDLKNSLDKGFERAKIDLASICN